MPYNKIRGRAVGIGACALTLVVLGWSSASASSASLNPNVAPGGNFDLSGWELQLPIGSPGSPTTISPAQLEGPNGFTFAG